MNVIIYECYLTNRSKFRKVKILAACLTNKKNL